MSNFRAPSQDQVQTALRRLTSYQLRRAFYEGLKNPLWVKPLADAGAFDNPPDPEVGSDGLVRERYWPEASYLANMAAHVPTAVVDVLVTFSGSSNSWVRRIVFSVGAQVPPVEAARLKPVIDAWEPSGFGWRTDPSDLVSFAVNLLQGGETKLGVSFANQLFRPSKGKGPDGDAVTELDAHWYSRELPRLLIALGADALKTVLPWLVACEAQVGNVGGGFDRSGFGRSTVAERRDSYREVEDALIDAVRDAAIEQLATSPAAAWTLLKRSPIAIVRRITMYAVAEVLRWTVEDGRDSSALVAVARELAVDHASRQQFAIVEFIQLLRALGEVAPTELEALTGVIDQGQFSPDDIGRISGNMRERGEADEDIRRQLGQWDESWRHRVLAGVGPDLLPDVLRQMLVSYDAERGEFPDPLSPPFQTSSWDGPNSPISPEDMAEFAPMELVAHLASWHDEGSGWGPEPSHEGQARVLAEVVTANPNALRGEERLTERLRPTYLRAILAGWEGALKAEHELPWDQAIGLAADVLLHAEESAVPVEGGRFDDDPDFTEVKKVALGFLVQLATPTVAVHVSAQGLDRVADLLLHVANDPIAWNEYASVDSDSDSGWDPLTISLNWRWPIVLRGLINLIAIGDEGAWHGAALAALAEQLLRQDERGASRAVLGEGLGKLYNHARSWLEVHVPEHFGTAESISRNQQIALTTAIGMHYYHRDLYELLSPPMIAALRSDEAVAVGWGQHTSPRERIGQWVIEGIIRGQIDASDPLRVAFYSETPPEVRGDAIGHTAWTFLHAAAVDDAIRYRLADLWDERIRHVKAHPEDIGEVKDFYWFIRSEKFPASWWLPRLKEALELNGDLDTHGMIGEQLAAAAHEYPREALDALGMLLAPEETSFRDNYDLRTNALTPVIAAALDSSDARLQSDANQLMNLMGARGEIELDKRVSARRSGSG